MPANFRSHLSNLGYNGVICYPSFNNQSIEACSQDRIEKLSTKLLNHAKIKNNMLFVGQGQTFQIWEPTAFEKFKVNARKKANLNRASLKWEKHFNNNEGK